MPGLRSLVARRRSSLTSQPYSVQRNTPSPSYSDTSDHAATPPPHTLVGHESPMTEREDSRGEVQATQGQDGGDVRLAGGTTQAASFANGEEEQERGGDAGFNVEDIREESLLETSEGGNGGGGETQEMSSDLRNIMEEKESVPQSEMNVVCAGSSSSDVHSGLGPNEAIPSPGIEQNTQQINVHVNRSEGESYTNTETNPDVGTAQHTERGVHEETNISNEEKIGTEAFPYNLHLIASKSEETLQSEEKCNTDIQEKNEAVISNYDMRQEGFSKEGSWGGIGVGCEGEGGEVDYHMTGFEDEGDRSESQLNNKLNKDLGVLSEEEVFRFVAEEGANEQELPTFPTEGEYSNVSEFVGKYDNKSEGVKAPMGLIDYTQELEAGNTEQQMYDEFTEKRQESPYSYVRKDSSVESEGENRGMTDTMYGEGDNALAGEGCGNNPHGGGDNLETLSSIGPSLDEKSREGNDYNDWEISSGYYEKEREGKMEEDEWEETYAESKGENIGIQSLPKASDEASENNKSNEISTDILKTEQTEKPHETKTSNEKSTENRGEVVCKGESSQSGSKGESGTQPDKSIDNYLNRKEAKGGKKCSDLSATEIESTLASRGVTIVRRVVDNKEQCSRGFVPPKETGTSIRPTNKSIFAKSGQSPLRGTPSSGMSVSLQPSSAGSTNSPTSSDLYKSINARGTHIQSGSKISPALLNRRGSFQLTQGVSIHYNPRSGAANINVRGNSSVYPSKRGVGTVGRGGPRMRGAAMLTTRGYPANYRARGAQTRRGTHQANLRGLAAPVSTRGMTRGQRFTGPRAASPRVAVPQPRATSVATTNVRGAVPQSFRGGLAQQQQSRLPGPVTQADFTGDLLTSTSGDTSQSRCTTMPPHAKYMKASSDSNSNISSLQSNTLGISSQPSTQDTLQSPQPGSAEVSPHSRGSQFSPQSLMSGMQPQSEYGGPGTQSRAVAQSPQSVHGASSASPITSQTGVPRFTSPPVSSGHPTLPSSSHHLPQMNVMDQPSQMNTMGLPPHTVAGGSRLPPHTSGGFMAHATSVTSSSKVMSSHITTSNRFSSSVSSAGYTPTSSSDFLARPGPELFPTYNNPGEYTPHSSTSGFPPMSSADFGLQSTSGGFHAQTNIGFPPQNNPCAYPQHPSSSEFSTHNPTGVARPPGSDAFAPHPSCTSFPIQCNPGSYPPIPCSEPFTTPSTPSSFRESTDLFNYPGQRDFMMHPASREFSHYSNPNPMANQLHAVAPTPPHRDLPMSQSPRNVPIQNCNQSLPMPASGGNSTMSNIGDPYSSYGEPLAQSPYQEIPVSPATTTNPVPLPPNFRESDSRQNYRDSATPQYRSYRDSSTPQEDLRATQMHSGYRDLPLNPNMDLQQQTISSREQSAHSSFKDQQQSARFQGDGMMNRYVEQPVHNYPESRNINTCREQPPVPNFGSPASHASPVETVMPSTRDISNQINFPETISDNTRQPHTGLGEQMNYGSYRGPVEYTSGCERPNPNLPESLGYPPNMNQIPKSVSGSIYKGSNIPVSSYNVTSHHLSLENIPSDMKFKDKDVAYPEGSMLPSFTESFDNSTDEVGGKKGKSPNLPHFRSPVGSPYQRNLPEYTNSPLHYHSQGGDASTSATKDYPYPYTRNLEIRESAGYSQRGYAAPASSNSYSPAQSCSPDEVQYVGGSGDNFHAKPDFHMPGDSLVPPDKRTLVHSLSRSSSSTNNAQRNPRERNVSVSSVTNPEADFSTSVNYVGKKYKTNFSVVESHKNAKESERPHFLGCGEGGEPTSSTTCNSTKSSEPRCVGSPGKFIRSTSPSKSDSGSPGTQERIVIKMKLLHSCTDTKEKLTNGENGKVMELKMNNKNSSKHNLAKYTRWTIDSIINGREDLGNDEVMEKDTECEGEELSEREESKASIRDIPKKSRRRNSDVCDDAKDTNLDTNKNFMKRSLKITIPNPLRNKTLSMNGNNGRVERKKEKIIYSEKYVKEEPEKYQLLGNVYEGGSPRQEPESQVHYPTKKGKVGSGKSPSPIPSGRGYNSTHTGVVKPDCGRGSGDEQIGGAFLGEANNHVVSSDVKKCSIVIKRIYKNDNFSCYSSTLCDKKTVLNVEDGIQRRSKRRAALEASEKCHRALKSLETCEARVQKLSLADILNNSKNIFSVNLTRNKTIVKQIPQCSVMLYDVFMNHRINQMVCPGCSRHYDSTDSVRVNMNKATISLLCSSCKWLVVKDVHPFEVDSLVPS